MEEQPDQRPFSALDSSEEIEPISASSDDIFSPTSDETMKRGRVAIVEDGEATRYFMTRNLRAHGYNVKGIEDGASAIALLRAFRPDIIMLDVNLPGISGFDVCTLIRRDPLLQNVAVILLTGRASAEDRLQGWHVGADDYLVKPCEMPEILSCIAAHLRSKQLPHEQWLNPISQLPAPASLEDMLQTLVQQGDSFAACYADITHFKSYNDRYGYQAGDGLLVVMADILREVVAEINARASEMSLPTTSFAAHLGNDDFVIITPPALAMGASALLAERFIALTPGLYHSVDRNRGWIHAMDRTGVTQQYPLVTLAVATLVKTPATISSQTSLTETLWSELRTLAQPLAS